MEEHDTLSHRSLRRWLVIRSLSSSRGDARLGRRLSLGRRDGMDAIWNEDVEGLLINRSTGLAVAVPVELGR
jgi:hypothetical protein